jgi:N6-adenosine-specific RNA methylase IME4
MSLKPKILLNLGTPPQAVSIDADSHTDGLSRTTREHLRRLMRRQPASPHYTIPPLPDKKFDIVYADPPWFYYGSPIKDAAAAKHYPLMSQEELAALPIRRIMNRRAVLFLWATGPRLHFALDLIRSWQLYYRGVAYVWVKVNRDGKIIKGQGIPPTFTKPTTEFVLAATTNETGRPFPLHDLAQAQVVLAPRSEHSRKPAIFRHMIEQLCGDRPRLEMFSRDAAPGWDVWGAEVGKFTQSVDSMSLFTTGG